jgi:hypothetical protein
MLWILILALFWIACGVLAYGIAFADFHYGCLPSSRRKHQRFACAFALLGPFAVVVSFLLSGFAQHGLRFK